MKKTLLLFTCLLFSLMGFTQSGVWKAANESSIPARDRALRTSFPKNYQLYQLDLAVLKTVLATAPLRGSGQQSEVIIPLPDADGKMMHFRVYKAPVIHPGLEAKYPGIQSYAGQALEKPTTTVRFSTTLYGLHTMMLTAGNGTHYIDPYTKDAQYYIVYKKSELQTAKTFQCLTPESFNAKALHEDAPQPRNTNDNGNFRTYRLAVVTTVEYSAFHIAEAGVEAGTNEEKMEAVLSAIAVTMTRVNSMYERDLSVSMQLIENNDEIVFIDSDELDNDDAGALLEGGQVVMTDIIGPDGYDIGHSFGTSGGGLAAGPPCTDIKGSAMTGIGSPVGDPFDIDYVSHEIGHQFGAGHTFNAECGGNRSDELAFEPGGGTTILAYAGVCDPVIQWNSDAQFHAISIQQMRNRINGESNCVPLVDTGNTPPVANAGQDFVIPKGTAFILEGSATDINGDALTYDWEQMNNEISEQPPVPEATGGPNFRSLPISDSPNRFMPSIEDVLANNLAPEWEVIPTVGRELDFALTVRDNNIDGGESHTDFMHIDVADTAGPFVVTSPNTAVSWAAASNRQITWDVAGTTANGVNTPFVDIFLSADGGFTYPVVLAAKVPNDGSETVIMPNSLGNQNRIMVRGHENIFYDLSNTNLTISNAGSTFIAAIQGGQNISACTGSDVVYAVNYTRLNGFNGTTTFSVTGNPEGSVVNFTPASATANGLVQMTVSNTAEAEPGFYNIVLTMTSGAQVKTINFYLDLLSADFAPMNLTAPENMAVGAGSGENIDVTLSWEANPNAIMYEIEVATNQDFTNIIANEVIDATSYSVEGLTEGTAYYWRVAPLNEACSGSFSDAYRFTTGEWFCSEFASENVPVTIPDDVEATVSSQLIIEDDYTLDTASVTLNITHTWITDISVKLISPAGTEVILFSEECGDLDDAIATFRDNGEEISCNIEVPAISGLLRPETPLSQLNGEPVNGVWTLEVFDTEPWDGGTINSWSLNLCGINPVILSMDEQASFDFMVYPNPNSGNFTVQLSNATGEVTIQVYDMRGRRIYEKEAIASGSLFSESVQFFAEAGVYLVEVGYDGKKSSRKIVVR